MIDILTRLETGVCHNCGGPIELMRGDLSGTRWLHTVDSTGVGKRECPGSLYAEPETS